MYEDFSLLISSFDDSRDTFFMKMERLNMIKTLKNKQFKITIISILLLAYTIILLLFSEKIFPFIAFSIPPIAMLLIFIIPITIIYILIKSINLIKEDVRNVFNWISLIILIITMIFIGLSDSFKVDYNFKKYFNDRNYIVNQIKSRKLDVSEDGSVPLTREYKNVSCDGTAKVFLNTKNQILISFCQDFGIPNGGSYFVYSSNGKDLIKSNMNLIENINKKNENWYYVQLK